MEALIKKIQEMLIRELEEMKNRYSAINNTVTEVKKYARGNHKHNN